MVNFGRFVYSVQKALDAAGIKVPDIDDLNIPKGSDIKIPGIDRRAADADNKGNLTTTELGFFEIYDVNIWNFCYTTKNGTRECAKPGFDWAAKGLKNTTDDLNYLITSTGWNITMPKELTEAMKAYGTVAKWTQIVFIAACIALGVELFLGLFANCSRAFSCVTWLISFVATITVGATAGLATATSVVVVGSVEATAKLYGADAHFNKKFLAIIWLGFAFAMAAGLFWSFTICCCAPDHGSSRRSRSSHADAEKNMAVGGGGSGYQRLSEPGAYQGGYARQSYAAPSGQQHGGAYEPYSHARA
ncbi:hypothetical protein N0V88_004783 [Collariella sp. IMI 366227]|nr:hypothetical protein N0V88_004783 [Collariella sp. IMI 366227]